MEKITVPYRVRTAVATYEGEWTAEEIDAGVAGEPRLEVYEQWYEPTANGVVEVHDPERIAELEATICDDMP